jgi:hypothetical protein
LASLQLLNSGGNIFVRGHQFAQAHEGPHDGDVHLGTRLLRCREEWTQHAQLRNALLIELGKLPVIQREVFLMKAEADLSLEEIAEIMGATHEATKSRLRYDLNQPGALERLSRENPFHYAMIRRILAGVDEVPEHAVGRWMKSQFNATDVTYSAVLMTSAPPRKQLSFTLETTRYSAVLTLTPDGARLFSTRP